MTLENHPGVFLHKCTVKYCERIVEFDDEPLCVIHSPDDGSSLVGYSAREKAEADPKPKRMQAFFTGPPSHQIEHDENGDCYSGYYCLPVEN